MKKTNRRKFFGTGAAAVAGAAVVAAPAAAQDKPVRKVHRRGRPAPTTAPMFNSAVSYGNLLFIAGKGAHVEPNDIKSHTKIVLDDIQRELEAAGSSMDKVLKCNVYLADGKDYDGMNEVFRGRFGMEPPVRTTIAAAWIPGNSLVEIDVIAFI